MSLGILVVLAVAIAVSVAALRLDAGRSTTGHPVLAAWSLTPTGFPLGG